MSTFPAFNTIFKLATASLPSSISSFFFCFFSVPSVIMPPCCTPNLPIVCICIRSIKSKSSVKSHKSVPFFFFIILSIIRCNNFPFSLLSKNSNSKKIFINLISFSATAINDSTILS